jgi:putative GTP pyrophosphokinase
MENFSESVNWYADHRPRFENYTKKIQNMMLEILEAKGIDYYNIEARTKSLESFKSKIQKAAGYGPKEMQDLTGLRIIGYGLADVKKICDCVEESFDILRKKDVTKDLLGIDKVGYQSEHFVCKLPHSRTTLVEFSQFKDMTCEIQVRTILQHAWAEIQHDRNYKFAGILPPEIQRRFNLLAASLEIVDNEFERISKEVDKYAEDISQRAKKGDLNVPINSTSLRQYLSEKIKSMAIDPNFGEVDVSAVVIKELEILGVRTLGELDKLISPEFLEKELALSKEGYETNYARIMRDVMILRYPDQFFVKAWRRTFELDEDSLQWLSRLGIDVEKLRRVDGLITAS